MSCAQKRSAVFQRDPIDKANLPMFIRSFARQQLHSSTKTALKSINKKFNRMLLA
jgi:hypothetical protein